jgi:hypothetical protein
LWRPREESRAAEEIQRLTHLLDELVHLNDRLARASAMLGDVRACSSARGDDRVNNSGIAENVQVMSEDGGAGEDAGVRAEEPLSSPGSPAHPGTPDARGSAHAPSDKNSGSEQ